METTANDVNETGRTLKAGAEQAQRQAREAIKAGDRYVRENPWTASGIAALAGLAIGFLVARR
jgi:ElaB/YqjD/DUF883 family membrane-anchored ribosome-binding protein